MVPVVLGKALRTLGRLRGGGSAFPGWAVLRLAPDFLQDATAQFAHGIVFVLGSNGKSTTTHMLSEVLRAHGVSVFTNPSGANLPQGIASSLLAEVNLFGRVNADIAVLEVDEAYALELAAILRPTTVLALNTQVDQLYRFYETERVADMMLDTLAVAQTHIVSNRDDPYLSKIDTRFAEKAAVDRPDISYFGVSEQVIAASAHGLVNAHDYRDEAVQTAPRFALAEVTATSKTGATVLVDGELVEVVLPSKGLHYAIDAAAAMAAARVILAERFDTSAAARAFAAMKPAYGRGELLQFGAEQVEFVMFKNAASLQLNLDAITDVPEQVMLAIDEGTPDISWIYDVDFSAIDHVDVITGAKAWQIALCLAHQGIPIGRVEPDLKIAIEFMRGLEKPSTGLKTWIVNYEQMMLARKLIGFGEMENQR
ncbi:MAG: DUF1727 domain-containing protein [Microbacteriaceae bacterium]|nr:DUF1727 domain-containing protein [Microbacteriaceae bacterium]